MKRVGAGEGDFGRRFCCVDQIMKFVFILLSLGVVVSSGECVSIYIRMGIIESVLGIDN